VNILSTQGLGASYLTVYAASKAFMLCFSEILNSEQGNILSLTPGWVDTPMTRPFKDIRVLVIANNECALHAFSQLGSISSSYGHPKHYLAAWKLWLVNIRQALLRLA